jgi:hypothetical protein
MLVLVVNSLPAPVVGALVDGHATVTEPLVDELLVAGPLVDELLVTVGGMFGATGAPSCQTATIAIPPAIVAAPAKNHHGRLAVATAVLGCLLCTCSNRLA